MYNCIYLNVLFDSSGKRGIPAPWCSSEQQRNTDLLCCNCAVDLSVSLPSCWSLCFCVKGSLFVLCTPGKASVASHSAAQGPQRAALLLVALVPFYSPAPLLTGESHLLCLLFSSSYSLDIKYFLYHTVIIQLQLHKMKTIVLY